VHGVRRIAGFVSKLAVALVLVLVTVVVSDDLRTSVIAAIVVVGGLVGLHFLRARSADDTNVWDPVAVLSIELPVPCEELAAPVVRALTARNDAKAIARSASTVTATVGTTRFFGGWLVTIRLRALADGGSQAEVHVEPAEGSWVVGRGPLDFGRGHRVAASIEQVIRETAAELRAAETPLPRGGRVAPNADTTPQG
jgi:hypothetical protein